MRVIISSLFTYPFHPFGGTEKYVYYLSRYLMKEGIDVEIITSFDKDKRRKTEIYDDIKHTFIPPYIDWERLSARAWLMSWGWVLFNLFSVNLARYLRDKRFDVLHSYNITAYRYLHFRDRAATVYQPFVSYKPPPFLEEKWKQGKYLEVILRKSLTPIVQGPVVKYCMTHADAIALEGCFQREELKELFGVKEEKMFELPVGVNFSEIRDSLKERSLSRQDLGVSQDDFVLISVNRFSSEKGIDYLVEAFNIMKQECKSAKLVLIGSGPEEERITKQIARYELSDSIRHLKDVPEDFLYGCYGISDVYVSPTLHTDWIMGIAEAMACGLPIVSTGQEWMVKAGANGYIVPRRDAQAMADALLKIYYQVETDRRSMGNVSLQIVAQWDWSFIAKKAIVRYKELCKVYDPSH